jgi:alcohol dehydrogenase (cytochrome c)
MQPLQRKPFYDSDKGKDLGVTTWPPNAWEQGGGNVWAIAHPR